MIVLDFTDMEKHVEWIPGFPKTMTKDLIVYLSAPTHPVCHSQPVGVFQEDGKIVDCKVGVLVCVFYRPLLAYCHRRYWIRYYFIWSSGARHSVILIMIKDVHLMSWN